VFFDGELDAFISTSSDLVSVDFDSVSTQQTVFLSFLSFLSFFEKLLIDLFDFDSRRAISLSKWSKIVL